MEVAPTHKLISRSRLPAGAVELARFLIGKIVVRQTPDGVASGRVVETEAYPVGDAAGHGFHGETPSNRVLFDEPGHAHVYLAYGVSWMLNVSAEAAGLGAGVLFRALEPLEGVEIMQRNRGGPIPLRDLARGPGRLARALDVDMRLDGLDLCREGPIWLADDATPPPEIGVSTRIGLTKETERPLRFYARASRYLSGPKSLSP